MNALVLINVFSGVQVGLLVPLANSVLLLKGVINCTRRDCDLSRWLELFSMLLQNKGNA